MGSSGTIARSITRCPAASASSTIRAPEVSVSPVLVSETVKTARLSDFGASAVLGDGLAHGWLPSEVFVWKC